MATAAPTGKSVYLYQLLTLTIDQGNLIVRKIFDEAIGNVPLHQFFTQEKTTIQCLFLRRNITRAQFDLLFPPSGNPPPTTADFGLTLLVCLLKNIQACGLKPNINNATPQPGDTSLEADLRRLLMLKNELVHVSSTTAIDDMKFLQKWNDIEQVLLRLNSSLRNPIPNLQQCINDLKYGTPFSEELNSEVEDYPVIVEEGETSLLSRQKNEAYRPPKETCLFDGRLIKLVQKDIDDLNDCKYLIGIGKIGKVYTSESKVNSDDVSNGFGIQVAVKKILFDETDIDKTASIRREMNASRILHPFILPLLAVVKVRYSSGSLEYWMVSPFFEKGDLLRAIENKEIPTEKDKVKILLQLAKAIQYLHTKVPNVRDVILHKDISSKNVVLDAAYNARLIDFGLSREKDDQTTKASGTLGYCHPDLGKGVGATECWDYFPFGVIVREMLTGLGPEGCNGTFLKEMKPDVILEKCVWSTKENASKLNDIADQCLKCKGWTVHEFKTNVVEKIEKIWERFNQSNLFDVKDTKCHICMINPKAKQTSMKQEHAANCQQQIEACIACEKYSFLNPITCYCGRKLTPLGGRYGALLIAGNDENKSMTDALIRDVAEIKKLLTSKAPCIIGISEKNVRMVTPNFHDKPSSKEQETLWPKVKENVKYFQEQPEIDTLLIYFSGHYGSSSFKLGSVSESISQAVFEELLNQLDNVDTLIIILDCCNAPKIKFEKKDRKVIQINACKEVEPAHMTDEESHFTKTLIKGLKGKAERRGCSEDCQFCEDYFDKSKDFVTVSSLYEYLRKHMKFMAGNEPTLTLNLHGDSSNIAYFTDEEVQIVFTGREYHTQVVKLEDLRNMEQLQHKLCEAFGRKSVKLEDLRNMEQLQHKLCEAFGDEEVQIVFTDRENHTQVVKLEDLQNIEQLQHKLCETFGNKEVQIVFISREYHTQVVKLEDLRNMDQLQIKLCEAFGSKSEYNQTLYQSGMSLWKYIRFLKITRAMTVSFHDNLVVLPDYTQTALFDSECYSDFMKTHANHTCYNIGVRY